MKTIDLTEEERAELLKLRTGKKAKASEVVSDEVVRAGAKPGNKNAAGPHRTAADIHSFSQSLPGHVFDDDEAHQEAIYDHFHQDPHFKEALGELSKMNMKVGKVAKGLLKASDTTPSSDIIHCRAHSAVGPVASEFGAFPLVWQEA